MDPIRDMLFKLKINKRRDVKKTFQCTGIYSDLFYILYIGSQRLKRLNLGRHPELHPMVHIGTCSNISIFFHHLLILYMILL